MDKKEDIETELNSSLDWIEASKATRIVQRLPNFDLDNDENIEKDFDWFIERATIFHRVFGKLIKLYKNQN